MSNVIRAELGTQAWVTVFMNEEVRAKLRHMLRVPGYEQWVRRCLEPYMASDHEQDEDEGLPGGDEELLNLLESRPDQRTNL